VASFYELAAVCQSLSQTTSRRQIANTVGEFIARLDVAQAEIAARFMVGRALAQGEDARINLSGRAIWKIAAELAGGEEAGEEIFAAAADFGEAIEMLLRNRSAEPEPTLTVAQVADRFAELAAIEGRHARQRKLAALRDLLARATALEAKYIAKILIREMRHGMNEGLMLEAIAVMANRPAAEVRRIHMLEGDLGRVVRAIRTGAAPSGGQRERPAPEAAAATAPERPLKPTLAAPVQTLRFRMKGSKGELYDVEVSRIGARLRISCTCKAGIFHDFCRHKLELLNDKMGARASDNPEDVATLHEWLLGTDLPAAVAALTDAEEALAKAQAERRRRKHQILGLVDK